jgi:hypothetical protein
MAAPMVGTGHRDPDATAHPFNPHEDDRAMCAECYEVAADSIHAGQPMPYLCRWCGAAEVKEVSSVPRDVYTSFTHEPPDHLNPAGSVHADYGEDVAWWESDETDGVECANEDCPAYEVTLTFDQLLVRADEWTAGADPSAVPAAVWTLRDRGAAFDRIVAVLWPDGDREAPWSADTLDAIAAIACLIVRPSTQEDPTHG